MSAVSRLVLWDIDKTLVDIGGLSREIYAAAFQALTGRPLTRLPDMAGRTDRALCLETLRMHEVSHAEDMLPAFYTALTEATTARVRDLALRGRRLAGAYEAVTYLARAEVVQTVVTGNIRPVAEAKLRAFELAGRIDWVVGGYGSDDADRAVLIRLAHQRATAGYGVAFTPDRVVVIGDTPHDMAGATANGVRAVGVASGDSTGADLRAAGAEVVLSSLEDIEPLLDVVLGHDLPRD